MSDYGKVYLVGAGIGSEEHITVRGKKLLEKADVIVYDRLLNNKLIKKGDKSKELINVGKQSSNHIFSQDEINEILAKKSREGKMVVRLKGGDPYVFGRGGEEALYLVERGIEFEVVPGITSGVAGLCFAGIPITHRDYGSSLHLITGHRKNEEGLDFATFAKLHGTMVFYMGLENLSNICNGLINNGKNEETPCAIISHGGYPDQKVITSNLKNIAKDIELEKINSPSLIVVGDVVNLREKLNFFETRPLFGKNIVVTRSRSQASTLVQKLEELGANVIELPTIAVKSINQDKLKFEQNNIEKYTHIIFTSANGVKIFMDSLLEDKDVRTLGNIKIFAIGDGTSKELLKYSIKSDFIPSEYVGEKLYEEIKSQIKSTDRILLPRALKARAFLHDKLSDMCELCEVPIYDTVAESIEDTDYLKDLRIDYVTFTSSSTVDNFMENVDKSVLENIKDSKTVSIGPITSKTIEKHGFKVYKEAKIYNIENLIKAILGQ
ncbi:uroporphyrinogen III methyltransferase/synthase [Sedimentibacter acidaminivorans]|uniref:uroporphyrinogen-III C-methyltransferase n=1 Tax=Sedimentibacter acidaminivorans TaxID=913099 RepID=A0ABS4GEN8_9FIRM|nr:uroporphyrinogen-III C-methyltransferase [Sedimentibacter acidaminivorans]MBP1926165.1 uroporphyrinogen III methyltransferase/synthase [Sedimentibacter acidaminivorans]